MLDELHQRIEEDPSTCPKINAKLSSEQRELLRWHIRLGHLPFKILKRFAELGLIPRHLAKVSVFPICACCAFANATKRKWRKTAEQRSIRSENTNFPGGCVSVDQLQSGQTGMIPQSSGERVIARYVGATVFIDNFSNFSYVHLMTSLSTEETVEAKRSFERLAFSHGVKIRSYCADNGRFADSAFKDHCETSNQKITFCGVGAHHQNGIAERHIRTLTDVARTILLHGMKMWPEAISLSFWPFVLKYASDRHNRLTIDSFGYTPTERFAQTRAPITPEVFHTWGCPVFALDSRQQSGIGSVPKWEPRSRMGVYLGFSPVHSLDVALVFNPTTGFVSPQYHTVFDDDFSTLEYVRKQVEPPHWSVLIQNASQLSSDENFSIDDETWEPQSVHDVHQPRVPAPTTNVSRSDDLRNSPTASTTTSLPVTATSTSNGNTLLATGPGSTPPTCPLPPSDSSAILPLDRDRSSSDLRVRFRAHDDFILPPKPTLVSEGDSD